jgi:hypothetical protein
LQIASPDRKLIANNEKKMVSANGAFNFSSMSTVGLQAKDGSNKSTSLARIVDDESTVIAIGRVGFEGGTGRFRPYYYVANRKLKDKCCHLVISRTLEHFQLLKCRWVSRDPGHCCLMFEYVRI